MVAKPISLENGREVGGVDPEAASLVVQAFDGVCKVGVFYPPGHALCDQAAEEFLRAMIRVIGPASGLTIAIEQRVLLVQGVSPGADQVSVGRMVDLLDALGVVRVELHRDLTATDLYAFVRSLYAHRTRLRNATAFQQLAVGDLPSRVRVRLREFQSRPADEDSLGLGTGEHIPAHVASLLATFTQLGLNPGQQAACRRLLLAIPDRLAQRRAVEGVNAPVNWPDIETALRRAMGDLPPAAGGSASTESLARLLQALADDSVEADPSEAVDLLVSLGAGNAGASPADALVASNDHPAPADDPLQQFLAAGTDPDPAALAAADRRELLGILMLLQRRDQKPAARTRIERMLREVIATGVTPAEARILAEALREMAGDGQTCLAAAAVLVCGGLRRLSPAAGLAFLCGLAADCDEEQFAGIWPFLVNEILVVGPACDPAGHATACARAASLSDDAARVALPRLESLECLHGQRIASDVFRAPSGDLRRILAWLLETTRGAHIARQLAATGRDFAGGWLAGAALPLIEQGTAQERQFLAAWLRLPDLARPGPEVVQQVAPLLAAGLAGLPAERRREPWVLVTIAGLGRCRTPLALDILQRIVGERRAVVLRAWPAACRRAAAAAMAEAT